MAEIALQRVLVDDDAIRVGVAGDRAADDSGRTRHARGRGSRRPPACARAARGTPPAGRPAPASPARRTRSAAGRAEAAKQEPRCGPPAGGTRARASRGRSAPRSTQAVTSTIATAPASRDTRPPSPANEGGLTSSSTTPRMKAVSAAARSGGPKVSLMRFRLGRRLARLGRPRLASPRPTVARPPGASYSARPSRPSGADLLLRRPPPARSPRLGPAHAVPARVPRGPGRLASGSRVRPGGAARAA